MTSAGDAMQELLGVMDRLRDPDTGCPWDLAQDYRSIVPHTLEEAYEVAEAIESGDLHGLRDELGDLLFQVVFYARLAAEEGRFGFADVAQQMAAKLRRRHPHVFGDAEESDAAGQSQSWEAIKARERAARGGPSGALDGVSLALPALSRAAKLQRRAARVGFDWDSAIPVLDKVREELDELTEELQGGADRARVEEELGDLLFACANLGRQLGTDPEQVLRAANRKFERRFAQVETIVRERGQDPEAVGLEALEAAWQEAKRRESERD